MPPAPFPITSNVLPGVGGSGRRRRERREGKGQGQGQGRHAVGGPLVEWRANLNPTRQSSYSRLRRSISFSQSSAVVV